MGYVDTDVGRVQGAGMFKSGKGADNGSFSLIDLTPTEIHPKLGDSIIDPDGEIWTVATISGKFVICTDTGDTLKGGTGDTPDINVTVEVDNTTGTPKVTVTKSGEAQNPVFNLAFSGLKGESENLDNYYTKEETNSAIALEAEKRRLADAQLGGRIDQFAGTIEGEATARTNGDTALTKLITEQIATEKEARETADTELQAAIDKLGSNLSDEKATREAKDAGLYKYITDAKTSVDGDLTALKEELEDELADETAARVKADAAEIRNRENADSVLGGRIDQITSTIENETTTRANADETLQNNIDKLKENTEKSLDELDAEFQKAVTLEKDEREKADSELKETLENELTAAVENEKSERETAVETEKSEREAADQNLQVALNAETEARETKDTELEGAILTLHTESGAKLIVTENSETYEYTFALYNTDGELLGEKYEIDLPLESVVVDGRYDKENKELILTLENGKEVQIPVEDLIDGLATETQLAEVKEALETLISETKTALEDEIGTVQSDLSKSIEDAKTELESALKDEETARIAAISEETGSRKEADLTERAERAKAVTDEEAARKDADDVLQSNIDTNSEKISAIEEALSIKMSLEEVDALFE